MRVCCDEEGSAVVVGLGQNPEMISNSLCKRAAWQPAFMQDSTVGTKISFSQMPDRFDQCLELGL